MRRRWTAAAAALAVAAGIAWFAIRPVDGSVDSRAPATIDPLPAPRAARPVDAPARSQSSVAARPSRSALDDTSLRGTQADGELRIDATGALVRDAGLVRLFDYWLTLTGEASDAHIRTLLGDHAAALHGDAVGRQVLADFDRYVAMRAELAAQPATVDLDQRWQRLREARRRWFGADAEAMFGAEEEQLAQTLARRHLAGDSEALAEFDAALPPARIAAVREATGATLAEEQTRQLAAADPTHRQRERALLWGPEAAARLAALDLERARWDRRVADYLRQRDALGASEALSRGGFTPEERARIEALDAIGALARP